MTKNRISTHPILAIPERREIKFYWQGASLAAYEGETISAALIANGVQIFGHHPKDHSPQGIFCANGQCSQCMVLVNGSPVKSCMTPVEENIQVMPLDGLPGLPQKTIHLKSGAPAIIKVPVLIIGGGPAGLAAAIELGKLGVRAILADDRHSLGGKLVLQTHRFFGSSAAVYAGVRGIDIAARLEEELHAYHSIEVWLASTALAVYGDRRVGILRAGREYVLVEPEILLAASGAREKFLAFQGNTLPGVFGAGAFQTLVNHDLVRPAQKLFIVGGGNVGLIAGYHALQAGIQVAGLVEAFPECSGYKVHKDKLARLGVPIYTSHTILAANGVDHVESVTIARLDDRFEPVQGSQRTFECDCVLIAVGLEPVNEFYTKALEFGLPALTAGDAEEIAEASAAIFSGKIRGRQIAQMLGNDSGEIPPEWHQMAGLLKSRPGKTLPPPAAVEFTDGVLPVLHCHQEIPCDPCTSLCRLGLIHITEGDIRSTPAFTGSQADCKNCRQCVVGCPGLAITLVDYRRSKDFPTVSIPFEFGRHRFEVGDKVQVTDTEGNPLGSLKVTGLYSRESSDHTQVIQVEAPAVYAQKISGIRLRSDEIPCVANPRFGPLDDAAIVCRCERVTAGEIRRLIRQGLRDLNELKTITRAGMGACGSKTCGALIQRLFNAEGVPIEQVTGFTRRPLFIEVPLAAFTGVADTDSELQDG